MLLNRRRQLSLIHHVVSVFLPQDSSLILGEGLGPPPVPAHSQQDPSSFLSMRAGPGGEPGDELDLSFLPDELSVQEEASRHGDTGMTAHVDVPVFNDSCKVWRRSDGRPTTKPLKSGEDHILLIQRPALDLCVFQLTVVVKKLTNEI